MDDTGTEVVPRKTPGAFLALAPASEMLPSGSSSRSSSPRSKMFRVTLSLQLSREEGVIFPDTELKGNLTSWFQIGLLPSEMWLELRLPWKMTSMYGRSSLWSPLALGP